jgi:radical SAM protein with 4Fe4S-binding SPASM domain
MTLASHNDLSFLNAVDELILSINGFDEETYAFHQKNGNFTSVLEGLNKIQPLMSSAKTTYVLQTVVNRMNEHQRDAAITFARTHGFNKVVFKSFNVMDGKQETQETFVPEHKSLQRTSQQSLHREYPCMHWMVINWNGDVNICCWDYEGKHVFGNINQESVEEIWNSEKLNKIKSRLPEQFLVHCGSCLKKTTLEEVDLK